MASHQYQQQHQQPPTGQNRFVFRFPPPPSGQPMQQASPSMPMLPSPPQSSPSASVSPANSPNAFAPAAGPVPMQLSGGMGQAGPTPQSQNEYQSPQGVVPDKYLPVAPKEPCDAEGRHVPFEPEVAYITDQHGIFTMVEDDQWNKFIDENCTHPLPGYIQRFTFPQIINKSLFELISDPKVQHFFRHIMAMVTAGVQKRYTYQWFCDSPEFERRMSMTISRITQGDGKRLILWSSRILYEKPHARRATYLGRTDASKATEQELLTKPIRTVCTYCKRILVSREEIGQLADLVMQNLAQSGMPVLDDVTSIPIIGLRGKLGMQVGHNEAGHVWLTPAQYAESFLSDDIIISHGVCELCYNEIVMYFYPEHLRGQLLGNAQPSVYVVS